MNLFRVEGENKGLSGIGRRRSVAMCVIYVCSVRASAREEERLGGGWIRRSGDPSARER